MRHLFLQFLILIVCANLSAQYSWNEIILPVNGRLQDIEFIDEQTGLIAGKDFEGEGFILKTINKGATFEKVTLPGIYQEIYSIQALKNGKIIATAWANDSAYFLESPDSGTDWYSSYLGMNAKIIDVGFIDENVGYGIGLSGEVYKFHSGTVDTLYLINIDGYAMRGAPQKICPVNDSLFFLITRTDEFDQNLYRIAGEKYFTAIQPDQSMPYFLFGDVSYHSDSSLFVAAGDVYTANIFKSADLGDSWKQTFFYCCTTKVVSIVMFDEEFGVAVGDQTDVSGAYYGLVAITRDGGETWTQRSFEQEYQFNQVAVPDTSTLLVIADNSRLLRRTYDKSAINIELENELYLNCGNKITIWPQIDYVGDSELSYKWEPAAGLSNPDSLRPILTAGFSDKYYLTASDGNTQSTDSIRIFLNSPFDGPNSCYVTYDTSLLTNKLIYIPVIDPSAKFYKVYRWDPVEGYIPIDSIKNIRQGEYFVEDDSCMEFGISYVDSCDQESSVSFLQSRFQLQATSNNDGEIVLSWTGNHQDPEVREFYILREENQNYFSVIDTVAPQCRIYIDSTASTSEFRYLLKARVERCGFLDQEGQSSGAFSFSNFASIDHTIRIILQDTISAYCGSEVILDPKIFSQEALPLQFLWEPQGGLSDPTIMNPVLTVSEDKVFKLTVTNGLHTSKISTIVQLRNPEPVEVCLVSPDTMGYSHPVFEFQNNPSSEPDYFLVDRVFSNRRTDLHPGMDYEQSGTSIVYLDFLTDFQDGPYDYTVLYADKCGRESAVSDTIGTIYLTASTHKHSTSNLSWVHNSGDYIDYYRILRGDSCCMEVIDSVSSNQRVYHDYSPPPGLNYYQIEGIYDIDKNDWMASASYHSSHSNFSKTETSTFYIGLVDSISAHCGEKIFFNPVIYDESSNNLDITWSPPVGISDVHIKNPELKVQRTGYYTITVKNGINTISDSVFVLLTPPEPPNFWSVSEGKVSDIVKLDFLVPQDVAFCKLYNALTNSVIDSIFCKSEVNVPCSFSRMDSTTFIFALSAVDSCLCESNLSRSLEKPTLNARNRYREIENTLDWHFGNSNEQILRFRIWRGQSAENMAVIDSVPNHVTHYTDKFPPYRSSFYMVEALLSVQGSETHSTFTRIVPCTNNNIKLELSLADTLFLNCQEEGQLIPEIKGFENYTTRFLWQPSAGLSSDTVLKPLVHPLASTTYYLTVLVDSSSFMVSDSIHVVLRPLPAPAIPDVDATNKVIVIQSLPTDPMIRFYKLLHIKNDGNTLFDTIYPGRAFIDNSVFVHNAVGAYRLSYVDACGVESELSGTAQNILLSGNSSADSITLEWNAPGDIKVQRFDIERGRTPTQMVLVTTVSSSVLSYAEAGITSGKMYYRIKAHLDHMPGNVLRSNTLCIKVPGTVIALETNRYDAVHPDILSDSSVLICPGEMIDLDTLIDSKISTNYDFTWLLHDAGTFQPIDNSIYPFTDNETIFLLARSGIGCEVLDSIQLIQSGDCINFLSTAPVDSTVIELYPNPGRNRVYLTLIRAVPGDYIITIYDQLGRPVSSEEVSVYSDYFQTTLSVQYPPGTYLLDISTRNKTISTSKLIIH